MNDSIKRKPAKIHYRKLDDFNNGFNGKTMQEAMAACLQSTVAGININTDPKLREAPLEPDYGTLVLNYVIHESDYFFGEILRFDPGADLPMLNLNVVSGAYNLKQSKAPDGHEAVKGMYYFMAINNHVIVLEVDLSSSRVERYLTWLLTKQTNTVNSGSHVILVPDLMPTGMGALHLKEVDEVTFKPASYRIISEDSPSLRTKDHAVEENRTLSVLRAAGMDETAIRDITPEESSVQVTLQIRFKGARRKNQTISMADTNRLLRNLPDEEIYLKGPAGSQRGGKITKLSYSANIVMLGSLFDYRDVIRALNEAYNNFVSNGYID